MTNIFRLTAVITSLISYCPSVGLYLVLFFPGPKFIVGDYGVGQMVSNTRTPGHTNHMLMATDVNNGTLTTTFNAAVDDAKEAVESAGSPSNHAPPLRLSSGLKEALV